MKTLLKIIGINLLVFMAYSIVIEYQTRNDWEGFAYYFYYFFFLGLQVLANFISTIIAAIKKSENLQHYIAGLVLTIIGVIVVYSCII